MEQHGVQLDRETFSCWICLDLLKDPVTIPCGHSYCLSCVKTHWDGEDQGKVYSCPQCRQAFMPRPVLVKSTMLAALMEQLKATGLPAAADLCPAGPEDVACDICSGRKLKALKSCLRCLASYCGKHLQFHYESPAFKLHELVDPSQKLLENICSRHNEVMKMFCRTDQQIICYLCSVEGHKGHDATSAAAEWAERQKELGESRRHIQQRIWDTEKDVEQLQQDLEAVNCSADEAAANSEKTFAELVRLIQKRSADVKRWIRSRQETEAIRVEGLRQKLQQEIGELRRKDAELELLSHTEDHNQFLRSYASLSKLSETTSSIGTSPQSYFEDVTAALSTLRDQLQDDLKDKWRNGSLKGTSWDEEEPKTRAGFLQYSHEITLDPNTAHRELLLSEGNKKAELMSQKQPYSHHADRFTYYCQVLSKESLTGRCYWELEKTGGEVSVAVAYKNISRAGVWHESGFGYNSKSWALECVNNTYRFWFKNNSTPVSGPGSSRVGVYLNHEAGLLSFYSVSETMTLLHRVQTKFTQPLYAGIHLYYPGTRVKFCQLKEIEVIPDL